jgi:hypothetical protein
VASPHLKEKELEWILKDIEVKKTHMSSDLRKSFALYALCLTHATRLCAHSSDMQNALDATTETAWATVTQDGFRRSLGAEAPDRCGS